MYLFPQREPVGGSWIRWLIAISLLACNASKSAEPAPAPSGEAQKYEAVTIKFSDPLNAGVMAYAKREGILEKELAKVNAKIAWVPAAGAFSANFEAMNSGAINASGGAISPIIGALSHNLQFKIFGISDPGGVREAGIVSRAGSEVKKVTDLAGKRVAVNWAAHGDYILLKALANHGVPAADVTRLPIQPPDAAAAFATGKIDAWSTFGVFYRTAVRNGANVVTREVDIDSDDVSVYAANVEILKKNPAAFEVLLRVVGELSEQARARPEAFQNVFAVKGPTAVSGEDLRFAIDETRTLPVARIPTAHDRARVANVARIFFENKSIDRNIGVDDIVFDVGAAAKAKGQSL